MLLLLRAKPVRARNFCEIGKSKGRERGKGKEMFYQNKLSVKMQHFLITLKSCWECG